MNALALWLLALTLLAAGLYLAWRLIGTLDDSPSQSQGHRLATPNPLLWDLVRTDRFLAEADAILLTDRTLTGVGL